MFRECLQPNRPELGNYYSILFDSILNNFTKEETGAQTD